MVKFTAIGRKEEYLSSHMFMPNHLRSSMRSFKKCGLHLTASISSIRRKMTPPWDLARFCAIQNVWAWPTNKSRSDYEYYLQTSCSCWISPWRCPDGVGAILPRYTSCTSPCCSDDGIFTVFVPDIFCNAFKSQGCPLPLLLLDSFEQANAYWPQKSTQAHNIN